MGDPDCSEYQPTERSVTYNLSVKLLDFVVLLCCLHQCLFVLVPSRCCCPGGMQLAHEFLLWAGKWCGSVLTVWCFACWARVERYVMGKVNTLVAYCWACQVASNLENLTELSIIQSSRKGLTTALLDAGLAIAFFFFQILFCSKVIVIFIFISLLSALRTLEALLWFILNFCLIKTWGDKIWNSSTNDLKRLAKNNFSRSWNGLLSTLKVACKFENQVVYSNSV